jgi:hypothetical protein
MTEVAARKTLQCTHSSPRACALYSYLQAVLLLEYEKETIAIYWQHLRQYYDFEADEKVSAESIRQAALSASRSLLLWFA